MQTLNDEVAVNALTNGKIISSYFRSLFCVSIILAITMFFVMIFYVVRIDFLNVNPHRSQLHALFLPFFAGGTFSIVILIGIYIIFSLSQITQAIVTKISIQRFENRSLYLVLATIPLATILSWYCFDYLTPTGGLAINDDADTIPFEHGLTIKRYLIMLCIQTSITVFSFTRLKFEISNNKVAKKRLFIAMICIASVIGVSVRVFQILSN
jgi:hypothetical protein